MTYYIGLMSGTSADGIDAALVDWSNPNHPQILETHLHTIPDSLKAKVLRLALPSNNEIDLIRELDTTYGQLFSEASLTLCDKAKIDPSAVSAIGSHGQTIRHYPASPEAPGYSLQIGDPNIIAETTGITTVADFRRRDIAAGGHGAPLAPALHQALFSSDNEGRMVINLGGIANITLLISGEPVIGFDTGPANGLMDSWIQEQLCKEFDTNGEWAREGKVHQTLLSELLLHPYLREKHPKSTGREDFNLTWLKEQLALIQQTISPKDVQATLLAYTVETIAQASQAWGDKINTVFVCGGGSHNQYLLEKLSAKLGKTVLSTSQLGVHPDWVEAVAFSWFAKQTLEHKPSNLPSVTGARRPVILGGVYYR